VFGFFFVSMWWNTNGRGNNKGVGPRPFWVEGTFEVNKRFTVVFLIDKIFQAIITAKSTEFYNGFRLSGFFEYCYFTIFIKIAILNTNSNLAVIIAKKRSLLSHFYGM